MAIGTAYAAPRQLSLPGLMEARGELADFVAGARLQPTVNSPLELARRLPGVSRNIGYVAAGWEALGAAPSAGIVVEDLDTVYDPFASDAEEPHNALSDEPLGLLLADMQRVLDEGSKGTMRIQIPRTRQLEYVSELSACGAFIEIRPANASIEEMLSAQLPSDWELRAICKALRSGDMARGEQVFEHIGAYDISCGDAAAIGGTSLFPIAPFTADAKPDDSRSYLRVVTDLSELLLLRTQMPLDLYGQTGTHQ